MLFDYMETKGIMKQFVTTETENESFSEWKENQKTGWFCKQSYSLLLRIGS
jgi:hypothetical protein